jgi:hypothetical protein
LLAIVLVSLYLFVMSLAVSKARGGPIQMTERGSSALVWLERHPEPGTQRSRAALARASKYRVWAGLHLAGVAWRNRSHTDIDPASPFGCIHVHESTNWHIVNPPYSGGLQFDSSFGSTYGPEYERLWGLAGHWPIWSQVVAAYRAWRSRGYEPWPNTSRACGLR